MEIHDSFVTIKYVNRNLKKNVSITRTLIILNDTKFIFPAYFFKL